MYGVVGDFHSGLDTLALLVVLGGIVAGTPLHRFSVVAHPRRAAALIRRHRRRRW